MNEVSSACFTFLVTVFAISFAPFCTADLSDEVLIAERCGDVVADEGGGPEVRLVDDRGSSSAAELVLEENVPGTAGGTSCPGSRTGSPGLTEASYIFICLVGTMRNASPWWMVD